MSIDHRLEDLTHWVHQERPTATLEVASADASFRRYFRVQQGQSTWVAMDAPPDKETLIPFIDITERLLAQQVNAPAIFQRSLEQGFLLLSDLGSTPYLPELNTKTADSLYQDAFTALLQIQQANVEGLPCYDDALLQREMDLMPDWFLAEHLGITLSSDEQKMLQGVFNCLKANALEQPQVFVHRDYHSRNLMVTVENNPGVIDFQDAVLGPICYDLVSLLRDCYISWPEARVYQWVSDYQTRATEQGLMSAVSTDVFMTWFDFIGLQRHIKVLGIFARLNHRDGKSGYLKDLPLTLSYVITVTKRYPELSDLLTIFERYDIAEKIGTVEIVA
ncbi:aminoglycoside phosphotransferase family protein [Leucothrix arctica]|uniref:Aminoglycoside phosphotransferase n=1 Tax=Leucothrix arctica TaxID=1481894 RepID=A0A317C9W1_9GAMM|nr:phosphotransferase [Leucothrix arctica]PWQ94113.1 aminoglycoside phosphotransferase [Leucothrix arctica]